jgi:hypothetical protein
MNRDEIVSQILGPGTGLADPESPPHSFFDPYISDAYRHMADEDTRRSFACLHQFAAIAHIQAITDSATLLSCVYPRDASPFKYTFWIPVEEGHTFSSKPIDILGVKASISREDDWLEGISYDSSTGIVSGIPDDGKTYWIPQARFVNSALYDLVGTPMGIKETWYPPNLNPENLPLLLSLTEWALQQGGSIRSVVNLAHAWAGGLFYTEDAPGELLYDPSESPKASVSSEGGGERTWSQPIKISTTDTVLREMVLASPPDSSCVPLSIARVRVLSAPGSGVEGYDETSLVRMVSGSRVRVTGSVPDIGVNDWAIFQYESQSPTPTQTINLSIVTDGSASEIERTRQVVTHLLSRALTGYAKLSLTVS